MIPANHESKCLVSNSELLQETVTTDFGNVGAHEDWMTQKMCSVFTAMRRKYGTIQERRALNQKYKNIVSCLL